MPNVLATKSDRGKLAGHHSGPARSVSIFDAENGRRAPSRQAWDDVRPATRTFRVVIVTRRGATGLFFKPSLQPSLPLIEIAESLTRFRSPVAGGAQPTNGGVLSTKAMAAVREACQSRSSAAIFRNSPKPAPSSSSSRSLATLFGLLKMATILIGFARGRTRSPAGRRRHTKACPRTYRIGTAATPCTNPYGAAASIPPDRRAKERAWYTKLLQRQGPSIARWRLQKRLFRHIHRKSLGYIKRLVRNGYRYPALSHKDLLLSEISF